MAEKHLKKCSTSFAIREMQIKMTLRFHLTSARMTKIKGTCDSSCWRGCGAEVHSSIAGGSTHLNSHFGNQYGDFSENGKLTYLKTQLNHSWAYTKRILHPTIRTRAQLCS
jgi:anaerobic selenocysteine-containing dehydrogenase